MRNTCWVAIYLCSFIACADGTPYDGPLWGDECVSDKGVNVISGCIHPMDGTGNQGWHSPRVLGICSPLLHPEKLPTWEIENGYTGACRPSCEQATDGYKVYNVCPANGIPLFEIHGLPNWGLCYCANPEQDQILPSQFAGSKNS